MANFRQFLAIVAMCSIGATTQAQSLQDMNAQLANLQLVQALGSVLATEGICGFSYDQDALAAYIDRAAPAGDMSFAMQVEAHATLAELGFDGMTESRKTALCRATENAAREHGFLK